MLQAKLVNISQTAAERKAVVIKNAGLELHSRFRKQHMKEYVHLPHFFQPVPGSALLGGACICPSGASLI